MSQKSKVPHPRLGVLLLLTFVILGCSVWANLSFAVTSPFGYRFFPPFQANVNQNRNREVGYEHYNIAQSLVAGKGFAHPFTYPTGPTAWQPPVYPFFLAGLLWLCNGSHVHIMVIVIALQMLVLIGTGLLVITLARQTTRRLWVGAPVMLFLAVLLWNFFLCFQKTNDFWLVLFALDLLVAGLCWFDMFSSWKTAMAWGILGALCAMSNPVVGLSWGIGTFVRAIRGRVWSPLVITMLSAALAVAPWTIRNYFVFGRFIPLKSNLALELYQSQCLQETGLFTRVIDHPYRRHYPEAQEFLALGEIAYLDRKWEQFRNAVAADPFDFADRVALRFVGATLWYVPYEGPDRLWVLWLKRLTHPLPFLALVILLFTSIWKLLQPVQWLVITVYASYLLPYVLVSYYDRYAGPLLGIKVLLVVWATDRLLSMGGWQRASTVKLKPTAPVAI
jgi:hypothetical protein